MVRRGVVLVVAAILAASCGRKRFGPGEEVAAVCDEVPSQASMVRGDSCFTSHTGPLVYSDANESCLDLGGGRLVVLASENERDDVLAGLSPEVESWIGLSRGLWSSTGSYAWITGEPVGFTAWGAGQPDLTADVTIAAVAMTPDGSWDDTVYGNPIGHGFLCEFSPWVAGAGYEFAHFAVSTTASEARQRCAAQGGQLADLAEPDVYEVAQTVTPFAGWVDAEDGDGDGVFTWASGQDVDAALLTDEAVAGEECLILISSGLMPRSCSSNDFILCQRPE